MELKWRFYFTFVESPAYQNEAHKNHLWYAIKSLLWRTNFQFLWEFTTRMYKSLTFYSCNTSKMEQSRRSWSFHKLPLTLGSLQYFYPNRNLNLYTLSSFGLDWNTRQSILFEIRIFDERHKPYDFPHAFWRISKLKRKSRRPNTLQYYLVSRIIVEHHG